jgi:hypothetical protein
MKQETELFTQTFKPAQIGGCDIDRIPFQFGDKIERVTDD